MIPTKPNRRPLTQAIADAEAFRAYFPATTYRRWEIAGSIRRRATTIGDVEHVIIPEFGDVYLDGSLFPTRMSLLWYHLDSLVRAKVGLDKHYYGATGPRWGEKYRGVDFRGFNHEIFTADENNWGNILTIRTGPAEFSQRLVSRLHHHWRRQHEGYLYICQPCDWCVEGSPCTHCDGTHLIPETLMPVPNEVDYFAAAGMEWIEPEARR